jgi:hypothetical protein
MTDNPLALRQPLFARVKELICLVFLAGNVTWQEIGCEQLGKDGLIVSSTIMPRIPTIASLPLLRKHGEIDPTVRNKNTASAAFPYESSPA